MLYYNLKRKSFEHKLQDFDLLLIFLNINENSYYICDTMSTSRGIE